MRKSNSFSSRFSDFATPIYATNQSDFVWVATLTAEYIEAEVTVMSQRKSERAMKRPGTLALAAFACALLCGCGKGVTVRAFIDSFYEELIYGVVLFYTETFAEESAKFWEEEKEDVPVDDDD